MTTNKDINNLQEAANLLREYWSHDKGVRVIYISDGFKELINIETYGSTLLDDIYPLGLKTIRSIEEFKEFCEII